MEQIPLTAQKRTILGRKVKNIRKEGLIPAHVFGHKVATIHVQVKTGDFSKVFEKVGETGIVNLTLDGKNHPVLIRNVQIHPVTDELLHIDFYQVNLAEKVKVNVPLEITSEAPAVEKKIGLLLTPVSEIEVEALPTDIPEKIEIDVSKLVNVGDEIKVKDLVLDRSKIEIHADEELVITKIGELVTKEMEAVEAEIEAEQAEVVAEAVEAAPEEVETATETAEAQETKETETIKPETKTEETPPEKPQDGKED